jgi:hypothetical protein
MKIKNYLLKNLKKILFFIFTFFIFFLTDKYLVNAATVGAFGGLNINSSKAISGNNGYSTGQGYYVTQSSNAKNFIEYTFCLTDVLDFYSIAKSGSISGDPTTVAYPKTSCQINNSTRGFIEKIYINVLSYDDAGDGNYGIILDSSIFNRHSYSVSVKLISVSSVDTITYNNTSDIINQNQTIIDQNQTIIDQNQTIIDQNQQTNQGLGDINDSINDSDTSGAQNSAGGFFNGFTTDTHGLTAIITAPLSLIESITSSSCSPLVIPLPYVDKDLTLPCMGTIYSNYFGSFLSIYQIITFGIVAYWVLVRIFNLVKDFKNPDHDEIEVLDL